MTSPKQKLHLWPLRRDAELTTVCKKKYQLKTHLWTFGMIVL